MLTRICTGNIVRMVATKQIWRGGPAGSREAAKRCTETIRTVGPTLIRWRGRMAKMFIAGESTGSSSGQTYDVINPATGEVVDSAAKGTESDVRAAIDAAHAAFQSWSDTAAETRAQLALKGIENVKKELQDL